MANKSLGFSREWRHKAEKTSVKAAFYRRYTAMRNRCNNKNAADFKYYGGKGICVEWGSFADFHADMFDSFVGHAKKYGLQNTTLDRIEISKNYSLENCRWATRLTQGKNTSQAKKITFRGVTDSLAGWEKRTGIPRWTIQRRLYRYKLSIKEALTRPNKMGANQYKK
jgi:hypothetical protein